MNETIDVISLVTYIFFVYLVLALLVERIVEILVSVYTYIEVRKQLNRYWDTVAKKIRYRYNRLYAYGYDERGKVRNTLDGLLWNVISDEPYRGGKKIISADLIRLNYIRLGTRLAALVISAILVLSLQIDFVDILAIFADENYFLVGLLESSGFIRFLLTTIAISIGSEPLHKVITGVERFAEKKRNAPGRQTQ